MRSGLPDGEGDYLRVGDGGVIWREQRFSGGQQVKTRFRLSVVRGSINQAVKEFCQVMLFRVGRKRFRLSRKVGCDMTPRTSQVDGHLRLAVFKSERDHVIKDIQDPTRGL
jgi:hypothetical protein